MNATETRVDRLAPFWAKRALKKLKGRKIVDVRYLTNEEVEEMGWYGSSLVIFLDDGSNFFASKDDEGNGPGALFGSWDDLAVIPVI